MKVIVKVFNKENLDYYIDKIDGFIIGIKDFSVGFNSFFSLEEIKELVNKYPNKEFFISMNKNIFNSELKLLESTLNELNNINISGVLYYDLSILYLKNKNNLNIDLVWNQTHMVTNYNTCNYYYKKGVKYGYISTEITLEEILEINNNTKMNLFVEVLSYQVMSFSRRRLLTNYYNSINKKYDGKVKTIKEGNSNYFIQDNKDGTVIRNGVIFNGINSVKELKDNNISYVVISEDLIDKEVVLKGLDIVDKINKNEYYLDNFEEFNNIVGTDTSFLFKKTIYKVKGDK